VRIFAHITDPTDLPALRTAIAEAPAPDRLVPLEITALEIGPEAYVSVVRHLADLLADVDKDLGTSTVLMLGDTTPIFRESDNLKDSVVAMLAGVTTVKTAYLGESGHLFVDDVALEAATDAATDVDAVVSVGSGTITDIAKVATERVGGIPLVVVQTAASVDGFTDNVSVILRDGAKRTVPSRWPNVVLADTTVIRTAPVELNTAGLGETLSLYTAPSDWWLAARIGMDDSFHETPRDLLLEFAGNPATWSVGLSQGNPVAIDQLTKVLAIRGMGTGIAGTTACLSGVEHVISHMLDMYAASNHLPLGLHGAQVGVASLVAAAAWNHLRTKLTSGVRLEIPHENVLKAAVEDAFADLDSTGRLGQECWSDYSSKLRTFLSLKPQAMEILVEWFQSPEKLDAIVPDTHALAHSLAVSGSPQTISDLGDWVTDEVWSWAVGNCHLMRNRFTVVDLLEFLGWWTEDDRNQVINEARKAGAHKVVL
jgi:glycerol-1-phosphate dehydrogenase [NAD(P)+]